MCLCFFPCSLRLTPAGLEAHVGAVQAALCTIAYMQQQGLGCLLAGATRDAVAFRNVLTNATFDSFFGGGLRFNGAGQRLDGIVVTNVQPTMLSFFKQAVIFTQGASGSLVSTQECIRWSSGRVTQGRSTTFAPLGSGRAALQPYPACPGTVPIDDGLPPPPKPLDQGLAIALGVVVLALLVLIRLAFVWARAARRYQIDPSDLRIYSADPVLRSSCGRLLVLRGTYREQSVLVEIALERIP